MTWFWSVSWWPRQQCRGSPCVSLHLHRYSCMVRPARPWWRGMHRGAQHRVQRAPVRGFVGCYALIAPVRSWACGAGGVSAGALTVRTLATCFSLLISVSCWGKRKHHSAILIFTRKMMNFNIIVVFKPNTHVNEKKGKSLLMCLVHYCSKGSVRTFYLIKTF